MSHATVYNVIQLGFDAAQFGAPEDWLTKSGLPQTVLDQAAATIRRTMGAAAYSAVAGDDLTLLREAESYLAGAKLWLRLEVYERSVVSLNRSGREQETISSRLIRNATEFEDRCWLALGELGVTRTHGFAAGAVITDSLSGAVTTT